MTLSAHDAIIVDHEKAQKYEMKYLARLNNELFARGLILTAAMDKFNEFLKLPKGDSRAGAIWDLAFTILSTAVPVFRLTTFIDNVHKNSSAALALAKRTGDSARAADAAKYLAARGARGAGKIAQKIDDAKDNGGKLKEAYEAATKEEESGENQLSKLDASRGPIRTLIADGRKAEDAYGKALDAESQEFENRLAGLKPNQDKSLEDMIKRLLPPVPRATDDELKEIETLYLWEMIGAHVRNNVVIVESYNVMDGQRIGVTKQSIEGLNDTQQETILDLFGVTAKRGKWFFVPPILPLDGYTWNYINRIGVRTVVRTHTIAPHGRMR